MIGMGVTKDRAGVQDGVVEALGEAEGRASPHK